MFNRGHSGWRGCGRRVFTRRQPVDRVRPVDVGFQVNVHRVSVWAVKELLPVVSWISKFAFWMSLLIYLADADVIGQESVRGALEIVMVVSLVVFFGIKWVTPKQPSIEDPEDNPPSN